jgi:hypothetical protein
MRELTSLELQAVSGGAMRPPQQHPLLVALLELVVKRIEAIIIKLGGGPTRVMAA